MKREKKLVLFEKISDRYFNSFSLEKKFVYTKIRSFLHLTYFVRMLGQNTPFNQNQEKNASTLIQFEIPDLTNQCRRFDILLFRQASLLQYIYHSL